MNSNNSPLTLPRLVAVGMIFVAVTTAWLILGGTISNRNQHYNQRASQSVTQLWGPVQNQTHPSLWYYLDNHQTHSRSIQPTSSKVDIKLSYDPKKKGLTWSRTYLADFAASYQITNPTDTQQTIFLNFNLPSEHSSYHNFTFRLGDHDISDIIPDQGRIRHQVQLDAGESSQLIIGYSCRGINQWLYEFMEVERIQNFELTMQTNFPDIDFLDGASSPTSREYDDSTDIWNLVWSYPNVIHPQNIGMDMPNPKNPGAVAAKISFFAPFSLLSFFAVLIIFGLLKGINLHPMNYIFLAAGFFAFHLLFAYLIDLIPIHLAFAIASTVSLGLIACYIHAASGKALMKVALIAQFFYLTLFSYSFLFKGVTGLTITIGSIATLAMLMIVTAKVDWASLFAKRQSAPPSKSPPPISPDSPQTSASAPPAQT